MLYDFHTHTVLSDGELTPVELIRRALTQGYQAVAITDHVAAGSMARVLADLREDCRLAETQWPITVIPGVELTHVPAACIAELAKQARALGAELVVVHGETLTEPVEPGTNRAAVSCTEVDILAHPGHLGEAEAQLAKQNGVFIEITARSGHSLGNGQVVQAGRAAGVNFLINSDTHQPENLLTADWAGKVARGAGLNPAEVKKALTQNPLELLERIKQRRQK